MTHKLGPAFREFLIALEFILKWEGGISNHPSDYGGLTNTGITQAAYDTFCSVSNRVSKPVDTLSEIEVVDFYWSDRYLPSQSNKLPYPLSLVMFDNSVLFSVPAAFSFLNEYINNDPSDYSPKGLDLVITRIKEGLSVTDVALSICDCREKEHKRVVSKTPPQGVFLTGWMNRLNDLRKVINQYKQRKEPLWRYKTQTSQPS